MPITARASAHRGDQKIAPEQADVQVPTLREVLGAAPPPVERGCRDGWSWHISKRLALRRTRPARREGGR